GIELESTLLRAQQGEFAEVESTLIHLAQTDTEDTAAVLEVLADAYVKYEQLAAAYFWGKRLLKLSPNNVTAMLAVAHINEVSDNRAEALQQYRRAVRLQPDNNRVREALARALLTFNEPQEAIVQFQELRSRGDESQTVLLGLARCFRS